MFDEKVAQQPVSISDQANQEKWSKTIRNYLVGRRYEMKNLLSWAENFQKSPILRWIVESRKDNAYMNDCCFDPVCASHELCAFLNLNLQGSARTKFDSV